MPINNDSNAIGKHNTFTSLWLRLEPISIAVLMYDWKSVFYVTACFYITTNFITDRYLEDKSTKQKVKIILWTGTATGVAVLIINILASSYLFPKKFPYFNLNEYQIIIQYYTLFYSIILCGRLSVVAVDKYLKKNHS